MSDQIKQENESCFDKATEILGDLMKFDY